MTNNDKKLLPATGSDDVWLGPFGFTVDSDGFRELFHAENDRYMRVLGLIGTVCAGWVVPLAVVTFYIPFFTHDPSAHINRSDFWGVTGGFLIGLFFILLLVAPPLPLTTRRAQEAAFMKYHGGAAGASEVGVRVWLCRYGFEEVTASGVVVRLPYALMRRPVLSRRFLFMGVRSAGRDSALWNSVGVNWVFRPDWDGSGGFVPRSCLDGAGGARVVRRRVARVVRSGRWRYRRACVWAWLGRLRGSWADRGLALMGPELEWLEQGERLNRERARSAAKTTTPQNAKEAGAVALEVGGAQ